MRLVAPTESCSPPDALIVADPVTLIVLFALMREGPAKKLVGTCWPVAGSTTKPCVSRGALPTACIERVPIVAVLPMTSK
jgi:hypothetical protein